MPFMVYAASKTEQERAFFKWASENKPSFAVNSVLPNMNVSAPSALCARTSCDNCQYMRYLPTYHADMGRHSRWARS
jgi:hypothetical protein